MLIVQQGLCTAKGVDMNIRELLEATASHAADYLENLDTRPVAPTPQAIENLKTLDEPLPQHPAEPDEVLTLLDAIGSPATVATAGPRDSRLVRSGDLAIAAQPTQVVRRTGYERGND